MKIHLDTPSEEIQIQIVPLIDVIFCILTFFILAALQLTRQQAITVDLPHASTGSPQMREMLVVTISPTGQLFLDKEVIDRPSLRQRLEQYRQNRPDGLLVLNASKLAFYNDVVQVLDVMRSVGGDRVALSTLPAEANQVPGQTPGATVNPGATPSLPSSLFGSPSPLSPGTPGPTLPGPTLPGQSIPGQSIPGQAPSSPGPSFGLPGTGVPYSPTNPGSDRFTPGGSNPAPSPP